MESEAADLFNDYNLLICGIGKVNASYHLMKAIQKKKPSVIVNLGSAGSNHFKKGEIVCCTKFIQRDMDVRGLGFDQYETTLSGVLYVLEYGFKLFCIREDIYGMDDKFDET